MPYPQRLHHSAPGWVSDGSAFHIRIRAAKETKLVDDNAVRTKSILEAARFYHETQRWSCRIILIMPDHLHTIVTFPRDRSMSASVKAWKGFLKRTANIEWQDGYFDHRLRSRKEEDECWRYIRRNPVRADLVRDESEWPWVWWPEGFAQPE